MTFIAKPREYLMVVMLSWEMVIDWWQINYRMRVTLNDGRQMTGQMLAFDKVAPSSFIQLKDFGPVPGQMANGSST